MQGRNTSCHKVKISLLKSVNHFFYMMCPPACARTLGVCLGGAPNLHCEQLLSCYLSIHIEDDLKPVFFSPDFMHTKRVHMDQGWTRQCRKVIYFFGACLSLFSTDVFAPGPCTKILYTQSGGHFFPLFLSLFLGNINVIAHVLVQLPCQYPSGWIRGP